MRQYRSDGAGATYSVEQVKGGGYDQNHPGTEANVNMQYAQAMVHPTPVTFYSIGGDRGEGLGHSTDHQHVVCYLEKTLPPEYTSVLCTLFAQFGARGISVLFASGDDGVGKGDCIVNDRSGRVQFVP